MYINKYLAIYLLLPFNENGMSKSFSLPRNPRTDTSKKEGNYLKTFIKMIISLHDKRNACCVSEEMYHNI